MLARKCGTTNSNERQASTWSTKPGCIAYIKIVRIGDIISHIAKAAGDRATMQANSSEQRVVAGIKDSHDILLNKRRDIPMEGTAIGACLNVIRCWSANTCSPGICNT